MSATDPIPPALADAYAAARAICQHHAKSFYFASHFMPRPKRDHAYAVYAFCRLLDDAADEEPSLASVDRFVRLLDAIYAGDAIDGHDASLHAFAHTVHACAIPKRHFLDLADGCRMDFTVHRYATWTDLESYCYRVAGVVGLIMCHVFDLRDPAARSQAVAMGNAMQLTNILRDVREDMDRGRIYLPGEDMDRFGVTETSLATCRVNEPFERLMRFEIDRARTLFRQGSRGLGRLPDDGSRLTACVMAVVYGGILTAIQRQGFDVFLSRARLSTSAKLLRIPRALRLCRVESGDAVPDVW